MSFTNYGKFDEAFSEGASTVPLRRRKTLRERFVFFMANLLIMPIVALIYSSVIADGLRSVMPIFERRLYQLPLPGIGILKTYDGFDRMDLSIIVSLLLFLVLTWLWCKVFTEIMGFGTIFNQRQSNPVLFFSIAFIVGVIILGDALLFYIGLKTQSSGGWREVNDLVLQGATLLYTCGIAVIGWWHSDFKNSKLT